MRRVEQGLVSTAGDHIQGSTREQFIQGTAASREEPGRFGSDAHAK